MLSKKQVSLIVSLQKKKIRDEEKLFVIEGDKIVKEFLASHKQVATLIAKPEFIAGLSPDLLKYAGEVYQVNYEFPQRQERVHLTDTPPTQGTLTPDRRRPEKDEAQTAF